MSEKIYHGVVVVDEKGAFVRNTTIENIVGSTYWGFLGTDQERLEHRIECLEDILCRVIGKLSADGRHEILSDLYTGEGKLLHE